MADDYLGRKMEDHLSRGGAGTTPRRPAATLKTLLAKNRECRDYDPAFAVGDDRLRRIIAAGEAVGAGRSAAEASRFAFRAVSERDEAAKVARHLARDTFATPPEAFIAVCGAAEESRSLYIDLGAAAQSMLLQAVEMGLNGMRIENFDREAVAAALDLEYEPLLILAVGRSAERAVTASKR